jgi:hypothetical protein
MAFLRHVEVIVGPKEGEGFKIEGLKIAFSIEKTDSTDPNKSKVQIYNLSKETSGKVTVAGNHITLKAGYEDETVAAILFGDVLSGVRRRDGNDYVTELEVFDSRAAVMSSQVAVSYAKDTEATTIIQAFLDAIGKSYKGLDLVPPGEKWPHGYAYIGMATDGLREVLEGLDDPLTYTIQNEMLYILKPGEAADNTGLKLSFATGLLANPQPVSDKTGEDDEGAEAANRWKFSTMLFPELNPGAACKVESDTLNGDVVVKKAVFSGDNWDSDFRIDIEAEAL